MTQRAGLIADFHDVRRTFADGDRRTIIGRAVPAEPENAPPGAVDEFGFCTIRGRDDKNDLAADLSYLFLGKWDLHPKHGMQFAFTSFVKREPATRQAVIAYLVRYASGIGPSRAGKIYDEWGGESVKMLRCDPRTVSKRIPGLSEDTCRRSAEILKQMAAAEDVRMELTSIFVGRGFPHHLPDQLVDKWGAQAAVRVRRDPFSLMICGFSGCGFARCDRLYLDLGLDPGKLKRRMLCAWQAIRNDSVGHTWLPAGIVGAHVRTHSTGNGNDSVLKAVKLGVRSGWLAQHVDERGEVYFSEGRRAGNEKRLAESVRRLMLAEGVSL